MCTVAVAAVREIDGHAQREASAIRGYPGLPSDFGAQVQEVVRMACLLRGGWGGKGSGPAGRRAQVQDVVRMSLLLSENVPLDATAHSASPLHGSCLKCFNLYRTIHGSAAGSQQSGQVRGCGGVAKHMVAVGE